RHSLHEVPMKDLPRRERNPKPATDRGVELGGENGVSRHHQIRHAADLEILDGERFAGGQRAGCNHRFHQVPSAAHGSLLQADVPVAEQRGDEGERKGQGRSPKQPFAKTTFGLFLHRVSPEFGSASSVGRTFHDFKSTRPGPRTSAPSTPYRPNAASTSRAICGWSGRLRT